MRPDLKRLVDELREVEADLRELGLWNTAGLVQKAREDLERYGG